MDPTYEAAAQLSGNMLAYTAKAANLVLDAAAASANIPKVGPPTVIVVSTDGSYGPTLQLILKELKRMADANVVVQKAISDLTNAVQGATSEISTLAAQLASNQLDPQAVADQLEQLASNLNQAVSGAQPQPTPPAPTPEPNPTPTPDPTPVPEPTPVDPNAPTT